MYSDTGTTARDGFSGFLIEDSSFDDAAPSPHSTKILLWVSLALASWFPVIATGYLVWSVL